MSVLCRNSILKMVKEYNMITNYVDLHEQIQANGFDFTLQSVGRLHGVGIMGTDNSERVLSQIDMLQYNTDNFIHLPQGVYAVIVNEIVSLPTDIMALVRPRSSLLRCGVTIGAAVWDAGYSGRSQMILNVHNQDGITLKRNARIAQMVFFIMDEPDSLGYKGIYQNENK
ncbi:MAG: deoxyuridine 5'-triphosphate nucleotidohydrolase [Chloroflexi bacterium]|nr:deoxyuridine 5'-triphosphate nucleotidohydrolase [Chloroflexota bacterium]